MALVAGSVRVLGLLFVATLQARGSVTLRNDLDDGQSFLQHNLDVKSFGRASPRHVRGNSSSIARVVPPLPPADVADLDYTHDEADRVRVIPAILVDDMLAEVRLGIEAAVAAQQLASTKLAKRKPLVEVMVAAEANLSAVRRRVLGQEQLVEATVENRARIQAIAVRSAMVRNVCEQQLERVQEEAESAEALWRETMPRQNQTSYDNGNQISPNQSLTDGGSTSDGESAQQDADSAFGGDAGIAAPTESNVSAVSRTVELVNLAVDHPASLSLRKRAKRAKRAAANSTNATALQILLNQTTSIWQNMTTDLVNIRAQELASDMRFRRRMLDMWEQMTQNIGELTDSQVHHELATGRTALVQARLQRQRAEAILQRAIEMEREVQAQLQDAELAASREQAQLELARLQLGPAILTEMEARQRLMEADQMADDATQAAESASRQGLQLAEQSLSRLTAVQPKRAGVIYAAHGGSARSSTGRGTWSVMALAAVAATGTKAVSMASG